MARFDWRKHTPNVYVGRCARRFPLLDGRGRGKRKRPRQGDAPVEKEFSQSCIVKEGMRLGTWGGGPRSGSSRQCSSVCHKISAEARGYKHLSAKGTRVEEGEDAVHFQASSRVQSNFFLFHRQRRGLTLRGRGGGQKPG